MEVLERPREGRAQTRRAVEAVGRRGDSLDGFTIGISEVKELMQAEVFVARDEVGGARKGHLEE